MDIRTAFPSKWLNVHDLKGTPRTLSIRDVSVEKIGDDTKPVIWFVGAQKGFGLNKTCASMLERLFGPETNAWIGQNVVLYPTTTEFKGDVVDCIRVRGAAADPAVTPEPAAMPPEEGFAALPDETDEVPF